MIALTITMYSSATLGVLPFNCGLYPIAIILARAESAGVLAAYTVNTG
jgi:hypothetical protein